jgi:hypothetical protein
MKHRRIAAGRHARGAVVWFVAGCVAASAVLSAAVETVRPEWREPEYGHKLHLLRQRPDAPVIALGSSRVLNGLRPSLLPPGAPTVFNFGLTRHGPVRQHLALERLLHDGVRPRAVTLEVFPAALGVGGGEFDGVPAFRHAACDLPAIDRPGVVAEWLEARAMPWHSHRFVLMSHWQPSWVAWDQRQDYAWTAGDADGWLPAPSPRDAAHAAALRDEKVRTEGSALRAFHIDPAADRALGASVARCRAEGIPVALVLMPEASWYRALLPADGRARLREWVVGFGVPVVNARDWCADADFRDGGHLIGRGVDAFTARFGRALAEVLP